MTSPNRRIVCATDFSPNASSAVDVAAAIAQRLEATLVLVHVADEAGVHREGTTAFRALVRDVKSRLRLEARRVRQPGVSIEEVLLHGKWAEEALVPFLEGNPPLLVVVSSVSKTAVDRWTMGSVSERVAEHAPAPTLVVRAPERMLAWVEQLRPLAVLVAVDFTASSEAALAWVETLRKIGPCAVTAAHIHWPAEEQRWLPPGSAMPLTKIPPAVRRSLERDLRKKVEAVLAGDVTCRVEANWGRPDAALVRLATEAEADLLVVGTHQRHGLSRLAHTSISRGLLRHAPMSVVCAPVTPSWTHGLRTRPRIGRVLVATDFSEAGDHAVPWAYGTLAAGGVVKLVHVLAPMAPSPRLPARSDPKRAVRAAHQERVEATRVRLAALVPAEAAGQGVVTEIEVVVDRDVARAIGTVARAFGPDIICVGAMRQQVRMPVRLGSVADAVVAQNPQPVLLVQPPPP